MRYWKVQVIESERGWGQRVDETKYFFTSEEATTFVVDYNKQNTAHSAPDWYMQANDPTTIDIPDELAKMIVEDVMKNTLDQPSR